MVFLEIIFSFFFLGFVLVYFSLFSFLLSAIFFQFRKSRFMMGTVLKSSFSHWKWKFEVFKSKSVKKKKKRILVTYLRLKSQEIFFELFSLTDVLFLQNHLARFVRRTEDCCLQIINSKPLRKNYESLNELQKLS